MKPQLVIIGNGMAGIRTVEALLAMAPDAYDITVFGAEPHGNYNRVLLSAVLAGEKAVADIITHDRPWYARHHITLHAGAGKAVARIDRNARQVQAVDGTQASYDRLLIATGSNAVLPEVPGIGLGGVVSFRDISDVQIMLAYSQHRRHAVVLGGGLLGLEAASGLAQRGMEVTVIHNHPVLMNRQLDHTAAKLLQAELERRGIRFALAAQTQALLDDGQGHVRAVRLADGRELACDLFIAAIGVRPNIALAQAAGLDCRRGIVVDDTLLSSDPHIFAVGECIEHRGQTFGLVAPVFEQAKVCAAHLGAGGGAGYATLPTATKLKVSGIRLFSVGDFLGGDGCETIHFSDAAIGVYKKLVLKAGKLVGAVLYGDTADGGWYQELLEQGQDVGGIREGLVFGRQMV